MAELSLRGHLIDELRDLLDAEQQITRALPRFVQSAASPMLRTAFEKHLQETKRHVNRVQRALETLGAAVRAKRCEAMRGLIAEGNELVAGAPKGALRDAMMITSAQKVEHYEMAAYGTARTYAAVLGRSDIARLLDDTLQEEKKADLKLTEIAEGSVNGNAAAEWHQQARGILEQGASWLGQTVGMATRQVRRAANAVGIRPEGAREAAAAVGRTIGDSAEAAGEATQSAVRATVSQARRFTREAARTPQAAARDAASAGKRRSRPRRRTATARRRPAGKKR
jgi:ferritin-like metal-binding protein YciE